MDGMEMLLVILEGFVWYNDSPWISKNFTFKKPFWSGGFICWEDPGGGGLQKCGKYIHEIHMSELGGFVWLKFHGNPTVIFLGRT